MELHFGDCFCPVGASEASYHAPLDIFPFYHYLLVCPAFEIVIQPDALGKCIGGIGVNHRRSPRRISEHKWIGSTHYRDSSFPKLIRTG